MKIYILLTFILFQSCIFRDNYIIGIFKINQRSNRAERIINGNINANQVDIYLNDVKIDFYNYVEFPKEGEYNIRYNFKQRLSNINRLFYQCTALVAVDLSHFDFSYIVSMYNTFREAKQLTVVDFSNCDVTKVNNMGGLFQGCSG